MRERPFPVFPFPLFFVPFVCFVVNCCFAGREKQLPTFSTQMPRSGEQGSGVRGEWKREQEQETAVTSNQ